MKRRSLLGSILGALGSAALAPKQALLPLPPPAPAPAVLGRSLVTTSVYADIASSSDGQVLRRVNGGLAWGALDLASCDAKTGLLPLANLNLYNPNRS